MSQIYCSNCGKLIAGNANFCTFCGVPQHGKDAAAFRAQAPAVQSVEQARTEHQKPSGGNMPELFPLQHLGSDAVWYFFLTYISKTILLLGVSVIGAVLMPKIFIWVLVGYFVAIMLGAIFTYNNYVFEIDTEGLHIKMGVIHKTEVSLPFDQVQNVNIERTLADRILGLAKISIETAGNAGNVGANGMPNGKVKAEAYLPGLNLEKAKKIHDLLIDGADGELAD